MSLVPSSLLFLVTLRLGMGNKIKGFYVSYEKNNDI